MSTYRNVQITTIQSDGSNGYTPGTWEGQVTAIDEHDRECLWSEGGRSSEARARAWAEQIASGLGAAS